MEKERTENTTESGEKMVKEGAALIEGDGGNIFCLTIIGQIEGHYILDNTQKATKYDHVIPTLVALEESDKIDGIIILINTLGGDVEAGLAIAEVISSLTKPTASVVLGGGHSIGVPLAVSADRSFIVPSATMTIHPVRTSGVVLGVPQAFNYLEKMQDRIIRFIVGHSGVEEEHFRHLINRTDTLVNDIGSILNGYEAVECGLIDEIGGIKEALAYLKSEAEKKRGK
jgi:ATP-dependent protease ClpP protease subunit